MLTEVAYLLRRRHQLVTALLESARGEFLHLLPLEDADIDGINAIRRQYRDQRFDLADVCLMYLAEREGVRSILTLDADFRVFRKADGSHLSVVHIEGAEV